MPLFNHHHIRTALHNTGKFFKNAYYGARKWGNLVDGYANMFTRGLGILQNEIGDNKAFEHTRRALDTFQTAKRTVVDLDTQGRRIGRKFEEAGIT